MTSAISWVGRVSMIGGLLLAGCATSPPPSHPMPAVSEHGLPERAKIDAEVARLRAAFDRDVPDGTAHTPIGSDAWVGLVKRRLDAASVRIDRSQLIVVADRDPQVQELCVLVARPADLPWPVIGCDHVSTGQAGRKGYFITPTGVFPHLSDILDYRALGTFNENHIRGLGLKGMRVWDFGWKMAEKGWRLDRESGEIRLQMHATDPDYLEPRLGQPASKGCIRVSAGMNRFLDTHGVLDADYERAALDDPRFAEILSPALNPTPLAGTFLVVVDSSS